MEKLNYPELVQKILKAHVTNLKDDETEVQLILDRESNHYLSQIRLLQTTNKATVKTL